MTPRESSLWRWLSDASKSMGTALHMCRVENSCGTGYPDVEGCYNGSPFHIELKVAEGKKTFSIEHFTTNQAMWLRARGRAGGRAWVLVEANGARYLVPYDNVDILLESVSQKILESISFRGDISTPAKVVMAASGVYS